MAQNSKRDALDKRLEEHNTDPHGQTNMLLYAIWEELLQSNERAASKEYRAQMKEPGFDNSGWH